MVLVQGELGLGKTTFVARRRAGAGRHRFRHEPDVQHRSSATGPQTRPSRTWTSTAWRAVRSGGSGLLDDYLGPGLIAFVEWAVKESAELGSARLRVTLTHMGASHRRIEVIEE